MFTLSQLRYALAVEKHRHFGKAASACHVSQPTLSQQLQKLEDEAAVVLFDRGKKPILPTSEGRNFLEQARIVLREYDKLVQISKKSQDGTVSGEFRLAIIPTVSSYLLPVFLQAFAKGFPQVGLIIEEMKTETILHELNNDRLDGAILATPIDGTDFKTHPLYYEPFFAYFSTDHRLLAQSQVMRTQLDLSEMWLLQDGHCFKDQVLNFCAVPGRQETALGNVRFQSGSLDTLRRLVMNNPGYTLLPALMALSLRKDEQAAHLRPFKSPVPTREISLIYRRDHWKLAIIRAIENTIASTLPPSIHQRPQKNFQVLGVS